MSVWAVVAAAGEGSRMGTGTSKTLTPLWGIPAVCLALRALRQDCDGILLAVRPEEQPLFSEALARAGLSVEGFAPGGASRTQTVSRAVDLLPEDCDIVLIHDGARPLLSRTLVARVIQSVREHGSGVPALPVTDTVKEVDARGRSVRTLAREGLRVVQTPQGFQKELLRAALQGAAGTTADDDAALLENLGFPVYLVPGEAENLKLTVPADVFRAEGILAGGRPPRVGIGADAHRLVPGRPLVLGGETIPFSLGLKGHSDADAAVHALIDALLGAAALGDIGSRFPDSEAAWKGVSSISLLRRTREILKGEGFVPLNADITIVAQRPRLQEYLGRMRENIAGALGIGAGAVSVKATTTEGMGFEGREEGISAQAVAAVVCLRPF